MYSDKEKLTSANITDIMQTAYIDYSMSVIVSRALPDARDGLKPVQRRILYAMLREGLVHNRPFDKCAGVVGEVLKNYHPHGDSSVYDTLVRLAQNWVMRYQLIEPQGNFGSVDGDPPAAYRYTECRLSEVSAELLARLQGGWSPFLYRLWYLTGAMHGVTFLGLGSLALLRPRAARGLLLALSPLFLWGLYLVASAPLDFARLPEPYAPLGAAFPPPGLTSPRLWTLPFNLLGTLLMAGVALYTTLLFRRQNPLRARGTALILLATLVLASTSALNRFGVAGLEEAGRALGVGLLYLGVLLADGSVAYAGGRA